MFFALARLAARCKAKGLLKFDEIINGLSIEEFGIKTKYSSKKTFLYIHIPFCKNLCPYCGFNRYLFEERKMREYFKSLKQEIDLYIKSGFKFSDFYFGGGTPTVLIDELVNFISYLKKNFAAAQITVETSPREINEENLDLLYNSGVRKLSIGIQSFNRKTLKSIGRAFYDEEEAKKKILMVKEKFRTFNVDLMFNLPFQSVKELNNDIEILTLLNVPQISFHPLMPSAHQKTPLEQKFQQIDISKENDLYNVLTQNLYDKGYKVSNVWCFSKDNMAIDEYYMIDSDKDYVGIGAGAISFLDGNLYLNSYALDKYIKLLANNKLPIILWKKLSKNEEIQYCLLTQLSSLKIDMEKLCSKINSNQDIKLKSKLFFLERLLKLFGFIQGQKNILTITQKGMRLMSIIIKEAVIAQHNLNKYCIENQI